MDDAFAELHAALISILRHALALAPLPRAGLALDLACGPGLKAPLLAEACGPRVRLIGVDIDRVAIRAATTPSTQRFPPFDKLTNCLSRGRAGDHRPLKSEVRLSLACDPQSSVLDPRSLEQQLVVGIVGDALALPLREGCCAAAFCIAALSLFADRRAALRELRRALVPGGVALLVVGVQTWAQTVRWPIDLAARLATAYAQALADGLAPLPATPDLVGDLSDLLLDTGFAAPLVRAFWLDGLPINDQRSTTNDEVTNPQLPTPNSQPPTPISHPPLAAELPLLPWPALRPLLADWLDSAELVRCDQLAAEPEVELCALALVAQAHAA